MNNQYKMTQNAAENSLILQSWMFDELEEIFNFINTSFYNSKFHGRIRSMIEALKKEIEHTVCNILTSLLFTSTSIILDVETEILQIYARIESNILKYGISDIDSYKFTMFLVVKELWDQFGLEYDTMCVKTFLGNYIE